MNKHQLIIGVIIIILLAVGLSGCNELQQGNTDIEIVNYSVESWNHILFEEDVKVGDGFIHTGGVNRYKIRGNVKNNAGKHLDAITIRAKFYDLGGNLLYEEVEIVSNLPNSYEKEFLFEISGNLISYFENIDSVSLSATEGFSWE